MKPSIGRIGLGPMSDLLVRIIANISSSRDIPLMLVASVNQVGIDRCGYVCNWNSKKLVQNLQKIVQNEAKNAQITVCRDHFGPNFGNITEQNFENLLDLDIQNGIQLVHLDLCRAENPRNLVKIASKYKDSVLFEVGTDETDGKYDQMLNDDLQFAIDELNPVFCVIRTGSLVKDGQQVGRFNASSASKMKTLLNRRGILLKEHNADYLSRREIVLRCGNVDAVNIAPELGSIQTLISLSVCEDKVATGNFVDTVLRHSNYYTKWLSMSLDEYSEADIVKIAGHYCFSSKEYKEVLSKLNQNNLYDLIYEEVDRLIYEWSNVLYY